MNNYNIGDSALQNGLLEAAWGSVVRAIWDPPGTPPLHGSPATNWTRRNEFLHAGDPFGFFLEGALNAGAVNPVARAVHYWVTTALQFMDNDLDVNDRAQREKMYQVLTTATQHLAVDRIRELDHEGARL